MGYDRIANASPDWSLESAVATQKKYWTEVGY
jgi:hypothetical protein